MHSVWHICDQALGYQFHGHETRFMSLHGDLLYPVVRCDTVIAMHEKIDRQRDYLCERCLLEFTLAAEEIAKKGMVKFR